jgi:uncharacterized protein (DUF342 family)
MDDTGIDFSMIYVPVFQNNFYGGNETHNAQEFTGDLRIKGSVRAGFEVEASGDLTIDGQVEDARVVCGGDMDIAGGAVGGAKGTVACAGSVRARRLERFTVESGKDISVSGDAILSTIRARGSVSLRTIVGGTVIAGVSIEAGEIGTDAETKTTVQIKGVQELEERKYLCLRELAKVTNALGEAKESIFAFVRDEMNAAGLLDEPAQARLGDLQRRRREAAAGRHDLEERIAVLNKEIAELPRGFIRGKTIFPGVVMKFGLYEKLVVEKMKNVEVSMDGDRLGVGPW